MVELPWPLPPHSGRRSWCPAEVDCSQSLTSTAQKDIALVLRDKIISSIRESIERSKLVFEECTFEQAEKDGGTTLTIAYRFDSRFFFRVSVKAAAGSDFSYVAAPGSVSQRESGTCRHFT